MEGNTPQGAAARARSFGGREVAIVSAVAAVPAAIGGLLALAPNATAEVASSGCAVDESGNFDVYGYVTETGVNAGDSTTLEVHYTNGSGTQFDTDNVTADTNSQMRIDIGVGKAHGRVTKIIDTNTKANLGGFTWNCNTDTGTPTPTDTETPTPTPTDTDTETPTPTPTPTVTKTSTPTSNPTGSTQPTKVTTSGTPSAPAKTEAPVVGKTELPVSGGGDVTAVAVGHPNTALGAEHTSSAGGDILSGLTVSAALGVVILGNYARTHKLSPTTVVNKIRRFNKRSY